MYMCVCEIQLDCKLLEDRIITYTTLFSIFLINIYWFHILNNEQLVFWVQMANRAYEPFIFPQTLWNRAKRFKNT